MTINTIENKKRVAEILLVEDNRGDAVLAARAFKDSHIITHLSIANSAEKALSMLGVDDVDVTRTLPDLILLDLNLPKMHGHEFLGIIKADKKLKHIPIIILSSSRAEQDVVNSYSHYASGYIVKPLELDRFRDLVEAIEHFFFMLVALPDGADIEQNGGYNAKHARATE